MGVNSAWLDPPCARTCQQGTVLGWDTHPGAESPEGAVKAWRLWEPEISPLKAALLCLGLRAPVHTPVPSLGFRTHLLYEELTHCSSKISIEVTPKSGAGPLWLLGLGNHFWGLSRTKGAVGIPVL